MFSELVAMISRKLSEGPNSNGATTGVKTMMCGLIIYKRRGLEGLLLYTINRGYPEIFKLPLWLFIPLFPSLVQERHRRLGKEVSRDCAVLQSRRDPLSWCQGGSRQQGSALALDDLGRVGMAVTDLGYSCAQLVTNLRHFQQ